MDKEFYSVKEVAELLCFDERTIRNYCNSGSLKATRQGGTGDWRIPASEIERFKEGKSSGVSDVQVRPVNDPLILERRREHYNHLADIAEHIVHDIDWVREVKQGKSSDLEYRVQWKGGKSTLLDNEQLADVLGKGIMAANDKFGDLDVEYLHIHLKAEYPEVSPEELVYFMEEHPCEIIDKLQILSKKKLFNGSCETCP